MKIGIFTDAYVPQISGVSTSCLLLKNELQRRGHDVVLVTTTDPEAVEADDVIRVPSLPFVSSKRIALSYNPLLSKRLMNMKLDVIHTQTEFGLGIFGRNICRKMGIPHVHTFHTDYECWVQGQLGPGKTEKIVRDFLRRFLKTFCNSAQHIIVPTEKTEELLESYGVRKPISIIPTGIDLRRFQTAAEDEGGKQALRQKLSMPPDSKLLVYVGRVSEEKRISVLFEYLQSYMTRHPNIYFVLVGDGPEKEKLIKLSREKKLQKNVIFTGAVPVEEVPEYFAAADVFLSASMSETQGLTYIEALASRTPILVQEDDCLKGVCRHGENGYFFNDGESFCSGLEKLLYAGEDEIKKISSAAYESSREFSVELFAERIEKLYEKLLAQGGRFGDVRMRTGI